ncbi:MAG: phosphohistidine phosphatase SixA [Chloroflexi bacterium]|nr:MAG: phosphohistidine phosphatase SixA [Chloroflexota bacterium]
MILYFFRHGDAEYQAGLSDHDRQLTPKGIFRTKNAAAVLKNLGIKPDYIFSSPRIRAKQTADILADTLGTSVEIRDELNFDFNLMLLHQLLKGKTTETKIMLVGHNPSMSEVVSQLTGTQIEMKKGGLARVDLITASSGMLVWLIAPKIFDAITKS